MYSKVKVTLTATVGGQEKNAWNTWSCHSIFPIKERAGKEEDWPG